VLLPRRNGAWARHLSCRTKGKVVIRVVMINPPARTVMTGGRLARKLLSLVALCASLVAFALIVDNQQGWAWRVPSSEPAASGDIASGQSDHGTVSVSPPEDRSYRALGDFVARKYRVSQDMAYDFVRLAHSTGHQLGLDPLLIIAVIAIESRFNPIAESMAGARGLMQIIPKYHTGKFEEYGGEKAVFDPEANVKVGARILKEYIRLTGNVGIALQMYAGALGDDGEQYTTKVMTERQRLKQIVSPSPSRTAFIRTSSANPPDSPSIDTAVPTPSRGADQLDGGE
jgi:hypothetical protein